METTVEMKRAKVTGTTTLEVSYPGLEPPAALFADLEMIGWKVPPPAPPPSQAIDWETPDEATGENFSIRDFPVIGAVVEPPPGSGRNGAWTEAERPVFERALGGVLARHGFDTGTPAEAAPVEPGAKVAGRASRLFGSLRTAVPSDRLPAQARQDPPPVHRPVATEVEGGIRLAATIAQIRRDELVTKLAQLGLSADVMTVEARYTESYRGSTYESVRPACHAVVVVPHAEASRVLAELTELGLLDPASLVDSDGAQSDPATIPMLTSVSSAPGLIPVQGDEAMLTLTYKPHRRENVADALTALGLVQFRTDMTTGVEMQTYRGTSYERPVEMERLSVSVPSASATEIARALTEAAQVDPRDPAHLLIEVDDHQPVNPEQVTAPFRPQVMRAV